jgi:tetratricopeptide (TPR) repeat protein
LLVRAVGYALTAGSPFAERPVTLRGATRALAHPAHALLPPFAAPDAAWRFATRAAALAHTLHALLSLCTLVEAAATVTLVCLEVYAPVVAAEDLTQLAASARRPLKHSSRGGRMGVEGGFLGAVPTAHLVAREQELGRILDALESAEGGGGRLVLLAGEPGIGKTRLAQEASVHAREGGFVVASGRCYEAQSGVPFYPFLEALGTLYEDAPRKVREEIPERWPYLARLLPDHFPLAASGSSEEAQRLLRAVTGFVREVCAERPVALLLDDLHHADGASVDLLAHLCRHTRGDRVLLLGTYRDVEVGPEHPLRKAVRELDREQLIDKVEVHRLGREETAALMSDRLNGAEVSEEFSGLVFDRTWGNPFFTVEVLKALIERGDPFLWQGRWSSKDMQDLAVPESVSETILERVSRLRPETRQALEEASVLGQVFGFEGLVAVVGLGEDYAEEALEEAEASGLVQAAKVRYAFDHALTQQTLYAGLSPARRERLHRAAGEGMERLGEKVRQKRAAEISRHFAQGSSPERALPYALLAGEEAEAGFAPGEAERQYRASLDLAEEIGDDPSAAEALERLGGLLTTTVRYDEALVALERASDIHRARKNQEGASRVEARIAHAHFRQGTNDEGAARLSAHLTSLDKPDASEGARRAMAALYCALARLYIARRRFAESLDAAKRAASLAREVEVISLLADAEMVRGTALLWLDAPDEGVKTLEEAVVLAEDSGALDALGTALLLLHLVYMVRGEFDRSREHAERGRPSQRRRATRIFSPCTPPTSACCASTSVIGKRPKDTWSSSAARSYPSSPASRTPTWVCCIKHGARGRMHPGASRKPSPWRGKQTSKVNCPTRSAGWRRSTCSRAARPRR